MSCSSTPTTVNYWRYLPVSVAVTTLVWLTVRRCRKAYGGGEGGIHGASTEPIKITELWVYPVKSCRGIQRDRMVLTVTGFEYDREWAIIRKSDRVILTQREHKVMSLIDVVLDEKSRRLTLSIPMHRGAFSCPEDFWASKTQTSSSSGASTSSPQPSGAGDDDKSSNSKSATLKWVTKSVSLDEHGLQPHEAGASASTTTSYAQPIPVSIWKIAGTVKRVRSLHQDTMNSLNSGDAGNSVMDGMDSAEDISSWLSAYLGVNCFLARIHDARQPGTSPNHAPVVSDKSTKIHVQDFSSLHLITEEGIAEMKRIVTKGEKDRGVRPVTGPVLDSSRFRPNIVVAGVPFPQEESWKTVDIVGPVVSPLMSPSAASSTIVGASSVNHYFAPSASACFERPEVIRPRFGEVITRIDVSKLCGRCSIPTIDPRTASSDPQYEPIVSMRPTTEKFYAHQVAMDLDGRKSWPMFGLNVFHHNLPEDVGSDGCGPNPSVELRVGDLVTNIVGGVDRSGKQQA